MKPLLTVLLALVAGPATAHPTHIIDLAGHNHWLAAAAVAAAAAAALWQAKKRGEQEAEIEDEKVEADPDAEPQEA